MVMRNIFLLSGLLSSNLLSRGGIPGLPIIGPLAYRNVRIRIIKFRMNKKAEEEDHGKSHPRGRAVDTFQQVLHSASDGGWENCWQQGLIPWDLGQPTPVIVRLHETGSLPKGTALVPGCGTGYDVVALACPERFVVGMDISDNAIKRAMELSSSQPNTSYFTFLKADFFTWHPTDLFDLIFDYTFFCAIEPDLRSAWAEKIRDFLKPDGELVTLMFPISDHVGGPPYKVSVSDFEEVLHPMGFKALLIMDNELAVGPRKGREKIGRWKRCLSKASL